MRSRAMRIRPKPTSPPGFVFSSFSSFIPFKSRPSVLSLKLKNRSTICGNHVTAGCRPASTRMCASPATQVEDPMQILTYPTTPIEGQSTGTSGLRKKTKTIISQPNFLPNWIQSLFNALGGPAALKGKTLILGGDGRFYNKAAAQTILRMAAANGIAYVIVGRDALLTTPAVSALIPAHGALGGIVLTASHNPAGPDGDWGIKYNTATGAPALEALTSKVFEETKKIVEYKLADFGGDIDLNSEGVTTFAGGEFIVEVIDPVAHYCEMLKTIFNFDTIKKFIARNDFSFVFDAMHASTGEYAKRVFVEELGASPAVVINGIPQEDFGGGHPDPNLTYAADLVRLLDPKLNANAPEFGAASDGDGDRNMILGKGVFVSPGDSVAIIADNAEEAIPYFKEHGVKGLARSMPTSSALDRVAEELGVQIYETPTGWKYFTNLMDAGKINICGEESFGTSSDHLREKDGIWAILAWLSILAHKNRDTNVGNLVSVEDVLMSHWKKYGRTYSMRYDYEAVDEAGSDLFMICLKGMAAGAVPIPEHVESVDEFEYNDPVDGSTASQQGMQVTTSNGGRITFRLSGTGSAGATIRIYFELHEPASPSMVNKDPKTVLDAMVKLALEFSRIEEFTERNAPTVIT